MDVMRRYKGFIDDVKRYLQWLTEEYLSEFQDKSSYGSAKIEKENRKIF